MLVRRLFLSSLLTIALAGPSLASAQEEAAPQHAPGASPATQEIMAGLQAQVAQNLPDAIAHFQAAIGHAPTEPAAHCHLAEAQRASGDLSSAVASYEQCARLARRSGSAINEGRGLLGVAQTKLQSPTPPRDTRDAITSLLRFAEAHPNVIQQALVLQMLQAYDTIIELDAVSAEVRQRRAARAAANAEAQ